MCISPKEFYDQIDKQNCIFLKKIDLTTHSTPVCTHTHIYIYIHSNIYLHLYTQCIHSAELRGVQKPVCMRKMYAAQIKVMLRTVIFLY